MRLLWRVPYRLYRLWSWARYRLAQRLTPAGVLVLSVAGVSAVLGVDTENTVTYQAFAPAVSLLAAAIGISLFFKARFSAKRLLPRFAAAHQPVHYTVLLRNLGRRTERDLSLLEKLSDPHPGFSEWIAFQRAEQKRARSFRFGRSRPNPFQTATVAVAAVPGVGPGQEVEVPMQLTPTRRGVVQFEAITLGRPDPFGLFRALRRISAPQSLLVLPRRYPLPPIAMPGNMKYQEGGVAMASNVGQSEEFVALRDYRRGDPLRHIHWRSWAKAGKPIVKEFEDEFFVRHALILDTFIEDPLSDVFEEAVSVAASFASTVSLQESLLDLLFVGAKAYCFTAGRGLAHADQMLEVLASVTVCPDQSFSTLEHLVMEHAAVVSGCICVLLAWDKPRREFVKKLQTLGVPLMVLVITEPGKPLPQDDSPDERPARFYVLEVGRVAEGLEAIA